MTCAVCGARDLYKCVGKDGARIYQNDPCPAGSTTESVEQYQPVAERPRYSTSPRQPEIQEEQARADTELVTRSIANPTAKPAFQHAGLEELVVLVPSNWNHKTALPVAVWLHGSSANPASASSLPFRRTADILGIAVVGIPGTRWDGPSTYTWAKDPDLDVAQIALGLQEASRRTGATFARCVLVGFSQGALVAAELAARYPDRFAGAIVLSPGGSRFSAPLVANAANQWQNFYISIGAGDLPRRVDTAREYRDQLASLGAQVYYREVIGMDAHARPQDWPQVFPEWAGKILGIRNPIATN